MWMLVARIYETHLQLDVQLSESSHLQRSVEAHWVHDGSACIWPCLASGVLESCPRSFHFLNVLCQQYLKERVYCHSKGTILDLTAKSALNGIGHPHTSISMCFSFFFLLKEWELSDQKMAFQSRWRAKYLYFNTVSEQCVYLLG